MTIFYADDDLDDLDFFREILDSIERETDLHTLDGGDSLMTALENPPPSPHMVFLDLNMPGKNGFQVLQEIRQSEQHKKLPIVVFSTSNDQKAIEKSWQLGANLYVRKPTSYDQFKKTIEDTIRINWNQFKPSLSNFYIS